MTKSGVPAGFSLVELVVALTLLSVGLIALAGSAAVAQRAFADAAATERSVRAAAEIIDSLAHVRAPQSGSRIIDQVEIAWAVSSLDGMHHILITITHPAQLQFQAAVPDSPREEGSLASP
jgi:prepilin-type N-terminal cleavage/methylation domain-containing protein